METKQQKGSLCRLGKWAEAVGQSPSNPSSQSSVCLGAGPEMGDLMTSAGIDGSRCEGENGVEEEDEEK